MMNLKYLFIIFLMFILNLPILCIDNDKIKLSAIEISIGGGLEHTFNLSSQLGLLKNNDIIYNNDKLIISHGFDFVIPFSTIFYIKNNFGLGFKLQSGVLIHWPNYYYGKEERKIYKNNEGHSGVIYTIYEKSYSSLKPSGGFTNEILVVNKFGDYLKDSFLLEYGILSNIGVLGEFSTWKLFLGPKLFLGLDKHFKNNFKLTIGGVFGSYFEVYPTTVSFKTTFLDLFSRRTDKERYATVIDDKFYSIVSIGLEIRLNFSYIKKMNE